MNPRSTKVRIGASIRALHVALLSAATAVSVCLAPDAHAQAAAATGGSIATPEGGGASAANALALAEVDPSTGILRASYPFDLETPRGKVKLSLGLGYSSAAGVGFAGYGWDLRTEEIHRVNPSGNQGAPIYKEPGEAPAPWDRFSFGDAQLVPICVTGGSPLAGAAAGCPLLGGESLPSWANGGWVYFRPEVEGIFARFFLSPNHQTWVVEYKDGQTLQLGAPLDNPSDTSGIDFDGKQIYQWNIVRRLDELEELNEVVYQWSQLGARNIGFLTDIYDTPLNGKVFAHRTHLDYETPGNLPVNFSPRWHTTPDLRLKTVTITSATLTSTDRELVRRYHLTYTEGDNTTFGYYSMLTTAQLEGECPGQPIPEMQALQNPGPACYEFPATTFGYFEDQQSSSFGAFSPSPSPSDNPVIVDFNSDGLPDMIAPAKTPGAPQSLYVNGVLSGTLGSFTLTNITLPQPVFPTNTQNFLSYNLSNQQWANFGDWLGNGTIDVLWSNVERAGIYTLEDCAIYYPGVVGSANSWLRIPSPCRAIDPVHGTAGQNGAAALGDLNADGVPDALDCPPSAACSVRLSSRDATGVINPYVLTVATSVVIPQGFRSEGDDHCIFAQAVDSVSLTDANGDGLNDVAIIGHTEQSDGDQSGCHGVNWYWPFVQVALGNGDGTFQPTYNPDYGTQLEGAITDYPVPSLLHDVNSDGLADFIVVQADGVAILLGEKQQISYAGPTQFGSTNVGFQASDVFQFGWDPQKCSLQAADMHGAGSDEVVVICPAGEPSSIAYESFNVLQEPRRALNSISNGQGATTSISYQSTAQLELDAIASGTPWTNTSPQAMHVVTRVQTRNNLPTGKEDVHGVKYSYRDPVYDGRQQRFRGFQQVTRSPFSATSDGASLPSTATTYLVGSCDVDFHYPCTGQIDEPAEPLRGLPTLVETFAVSQNQTIYASTRHVSYELRKLYAGLDGRFVRFASVEQTDQFVYDTTPFVSAPQPSVSLPGIDAIDDSSTLTLPGSVTPRAPYAEIRNRRAVDYFGNVADTWNDGNVASGSTDKTIDTLYLWAAYGADGWSWRATTTVVTGESGFPGGRAVLVQYDTLGRPTGIQAALAGTLPLERFHEDPTQHVASTPTNASADGLVTLATMSYDAFGNLQHATSPDGGCVDTTYDPLFSQLPTTSTVYVGPATGAGGCGATALTTISVYDRGLEQTKMTTAPTGAVSFATYDGLGRPLTITRPGGTAAGLTTISYPDPPAGSVARLMYVTESAGDSGGIAHSSWTYTDGFGHTVLTLSLADPSAGDGGQWIASGLPNRNGEGLPINHFLPGFYSGDPTQYPLGQSPSAASTRTTYDAFGRVVATYEVDGQQVSRAAYHALSNDSWDARQVATGQLPSTYTRDGHGRLSNVIRYGKPDSVEEQFTYDAPGDLLSVSQIHYGTSDPPVTRWMQYDTLGRVVLNAEANTSAGFTPTPGATTGLKAWRYAYDDAGHLVGTSDARGCGVNLGYDAGGRPTYEDYSPCLKSQLTYTPLQAAGQLTGAGAEVFYSYDAPEAGQTTDFGGNASYLVGQVVASYDRSSHTRYAYDVRGRVTGVARQLAYPTSVEAAGQYTPWWYRRGTTYDGVDRPVFTSTGADVPDLFGSDGASTLYTTYTARGAVAQVAGSYGTLLQSQVFASDGFMTQQTFGDIAATTSVFTPDARRRVAHATFSRSAPALWSQPTNGYVPPASAQISLQTILADWRFYYGPTNEPTEIVDGRNAAEWPDNAGAKPVTRTMGYDSFGRLNAINYAYATATTTDTFVSPLEAEALRGDTSALPFTLKSNRVAWQTYNYDWLGNMTSSQDDSSDYWDRSIGTMTPGTATAGPNQLVHAQTPGIGTVDATYDGAGNTVSLAVVRSSCATGATCAYRFVYDWDEVGHLARARRWDFNSASQVQTYPYPAFPTQTANVDLSYSYDAGGARVLKVTTSADGTQSTSAEIFPTLRLDNTWFDDTQGDYVRSETTESVYLGSPVGTLGRLVYDSTLPSAGGALHVFLEIGDHLGSATTVIDKGTSELVERITYQAYGATESDYRPTRWASQRETYRFTGKEDDIDVGLTYFGARYYSPSMARWISADPLAIHGLGADLNPYRYVGDSPLANVDPFGLEYGDDSSDAGGGGSDISGAQEQGGSSSGSGEDDGGTGGCVGAACEGNDDDSPTSVGVASGNDGLGTMVIPAGGGFAPGTPAPSGSSGNPNAFLCGGSCGGMNVLGDDDLRSGDLDFEVVLSVVTSVMEWQADQDANADALASATCAQEGRCFNPDYAIPVAGLELAAQDAVMFVYHGFNPVRVPEPSSVDSSSNGWSAAVAVTGITLATVFSRGRATMRAEGIALREGEEAAYGMHGHHIFVQEKALAEEFEAAGINIEEYRVQLSEGTHLDQLHSTNGIPGIGPGGIWNETWRQYFAGEANAGRASTQNGLLEQAAQMLHDFNVPYYSPLPGP